METWRCLGDFLWSLFSGPQALLTVGLCFLISAGVWRVCKIKTKWTPATLAKIGVAAVLFYALLAFLAAVARDVSGGESLAPVAGLASAGRDPARPIVVSKGRPYVGPIRKGETVWLDAQTLEYQVRVEPLVGFHLHTTFGKVVYVSPSTMDPPSATSLPPLFGVEPDEDTTLYIRRTDS